MNIINRIITFLVGSLFIFSGLIKINDPVGTSLKMEEYFQVFSLDFAPFFEYLIPYALPVAVIMCVLEVYLGAALLVGFKKKATLYSLFGLIIFFTFLTFYSAYFNKVTDCGCFGDAIKLTPWQSFSKDVLLFILIGGLISLHKEEPNKIQDTNVVGAFVAQFALIISLGASYYAISHLPFIDFLPYKVGNSIPELMKPKEKPIYEYTMEKDGKEYKFADYPQDTTYKYKSLKTLNQDAITPIITDYALSSPTREDFTQKSFEGKKLLIVIAGVGKTKKEVFAEINALHKAAEGSGIDFWIVTSEPEGTFNVFRHEMQLAVPYYFADEKVLKTIARANPTLFLMNKGVVKAKWHHNDIPSIETLKKVAE